jgi:hypothetical protein
MLKCSLFYLRYFTQLGKVMDGKGNYYHQKILDICTDTKSRLIGNILSETVCVSLWIHQE